MFLLTGAARSGTSFFSKLLSQVGSLFCVHESMTDFMITTSDRSDFGRVFYADRVDSFFIRQMYSHGICPESVTTYGIKAPFPDISMVHFVQIPNIKIVAIMRHPVDLFLSQHKRDIDGTPWPREIFMRDGGVYKANIYNNYYNFVANLNRDHVKVVKFEDIVGNRLLLSDVCAFLDNSLALSPGDCEKAYESMSSFGKKPGGAISTVTGCADDRANDDTQIVSFYTEIAKRFCSDTSSRLGYEIS